MTISQILRQEEEIQTIIKETWCKLAPSPIHGIGVFAIRDIKKGQKLYLVPKEICKWYKIPYSVLKTRLNDYPEILELILERWPAIINGSHYLLPNDMVILLTYMNHSKDPNYHSCSEDCPKGCPELNDRAIKDIPKGTEITENYKNMLNYDKIYPWLKD